LIAHAALEHSHKTAADETPKGDEVAPQGDQVAPSGDQVVPGAKSASARVRVIVGIIVGDFFHNFCDGLFIGAAFKGCGESFGWSVASGTVLHEISQELADYTVLTGGVAKLHPALALLFNFLSGTSVTLGVIIVLLGDISYDNIGLMLAFGGGVYLHIAATECMPKLYNPELSLPARAASLLLFIVGAVAVGLVLIDHSHCVVEDTATSGEGGGGGGHEGHGH
jgi:zinc transporter ZupT